MRPVHIRLTTPCWVANRRARQYLNAQLHIWAAPMPLSYPALKTHGRVRRAKWRGRNNIATDLPLVAGKQLPPTRSRPGPAGLTYTQPIGPPLLLSTPSSKGCFDFETDRSESLGRSSLGN